MSEKVAIQLNGLVVRCAIARTADEHSDGLQRFASLAPDEGLLFLFDRPAYRTFAMKAVSFPIDIVFLQNGKVARIAESIFPGDAELYSARCDQVLEVPAGLTRQAHLRVGDVVELADMSENSLFANQERKTADGFSRSADGFSRSADGFNEPFSEQDREIHEREQDHPDEQYRDRLMPDDVTKSSPGMYDEAKDEYFHSLWGDELANQAMDPEVRPELQTRVGAVEKTAGRSIVVTIPESKLGEIAREEADVARREQAGEHLNYFWSMGRLPKEQPQRVFFAWDGAVRAYHEVTAMDREAGRIYMSTEIHELPHAIEMEPFRGYRYFDWPGQTKSAQVVDSAKFVEKIAPILFAHADKLQWKKDALNGGATERAVVSRADLAQWLSGNQETGQGAALPDATKFIVQAAGDDNGMRLIGTAFVLAELADYSRIGFSGRNAVLVLYRQASRPNEGANAGPAQPV
jgi:uncharacterized membrane protein (UPF0127 family)